MSETLETSEAEDSGQDGYGSSPMAGMGPEMAADPQPVWKALRDEMPVMPIDGLPSGGHGVLLTRGTPRSTRPTWTRSTSRTSGR
jgi:hypothetical protein